MKATQYIRTGIVLMVPLLFGHSTLAAVTGSSPFNKDGLLIGHVDYTAYWPGEYSVSITDYVYAYQVFNDADSKVGIDYFSVGFPASAQITMSPWCSPTAPGDVIPTPFLASTSALFIFPTGIKAGANSATLLFASNRESTTGVGVVAGGVAGSVNVGVLSPVPEPGTLGLLIGGALLTFRQRRIREKKIA